MTGQTNLILQTRFPQKITIRPKKLDLVGFSTFADFNCNND